MSHFGTGVEHSLHCPLYLVDVTVEHSPSARDLAQFQGVSPTYGAKLFTRLEKAGLVLLAEGVCGGFRLTMRKAEACMRGSLRNQSLADLAGRVAPRLPPTFVKYAQSWSRERRSGRQQKRAC